jgi:hypothetical protein
MGGMYIGQHERPNKDFSSGRLWDFGGHIDAVLSYEHQSLASPILFILGPSYISASTTRVLTWTTSVI